MGRPRKIAPGIGERLVSLYEGGSREDFAAALGISKSTLANYERGDNEPSFAVLNKIRDYAQVDLNWLVAGAKPPAPSEPAEATSDATWVSIARFDIQAAAGDGAVVLDNREDGAMAIDAAWLARFVPPGAMVSMLEARGESMEPVIRDGDLLLVSHDIDERDVRDGGIFVVTHYGGLKVKRLQSWQGGIRVSSDGGERYGVDIVPEDRVGEDLVIHARVFWSGGRLRNV